MKSPIILVLFAFLSSIGYAQTFANTYQIAVGKYKSGGVAIESFEISTDLFGNQTKFSKGDYYINATSTGSLITHIKKGSEWFKLNEIHKKEFEKELCRIKVTERNIYEINKRFMIEFSNEMRILFRGFNSGYSIIEIYIDNMPFLSLRTLQQIDDFEKMLKGQFKNEGIDEIFK